MAHTVQLDWRPADGAGASTASSPRPPADGAGASSSPRPLVVLLPWVWAAPSHVSKYVSLCHEAGWDVMVVSWPMLALWAPAWAAHNAAAVVDAIGGRLMEQGARPIVFWAFSGAAKGVYSSVLAQLAAKPQQGQQLNARAARALAAAALLRRCCVGQVLDSPVDFTSDVGRKLFAQAFAQAAGSSGSNISSGGGGAAAAVRAAVAAAGVAVDASAGLLDFVLLEAWDSQREAMWSALRNPPVRGPVLLLYSRSDSMADAAQIAALAGALRCKGRPVLEQVFQDSGHVGHLSVHPCEYRDALAYLLDQALHEWAAANSRLQEGQQLAARWHDDEQQQEWQPQQEQQQQQQPGEEQHMLVPQPARGVQPLAHGKHRQGRAAGGGAEPGDCGGQPGVPGGSTTACCCAAAAPPAGGACAGGCQGGGSGGRQSAHDQRGAREAAGAEAAGAQAGPGFSGRALDVREQQLFSRQLTRCALLAAVGPGGGGGASSCAAAAGLSVAAAAAAMDGTFVSVSCSTTLSHSLRCMMMAREASLSRQQVGAADEGGSAAPAGQPQQPQQQVQQQSFARRMLLRLRSRL